LFWGNMRNGEQPHSGTRFLLFAFWLPQSLVSRSLAKTAQAVFFWIAAGEAIQTPIANAQRRCEEAALGG